MKILMLLEHHYPPDIRVEKEIDSLLGAGHSVVLACSTLTGETTTECHSNLTIIRKKMSTFTYKASVGSLKFPFYFNFWRRFIKEIFESYEADVIHLHDLPLAAVVVEIVKDREISFILDSHENYPYMLESASHTQSLLGKMLSNTKQWLNYEKAMLQKADIILSIIEEQKTRFVKLGVPEEKIFIVSNTPVLEITKPMTTEHSGFIYVYAGNIYATKGLDIMIEAFEVLRKQRPDSKLWIVGDFKRKKMANNLPLGSLDARNIKCWGWQPLKELYNIISQADVALLPHKKNRNSDYGIPNKLFQYMMMGKPVIASNCIPIERIIKETEAGLIYQHNDADELAEKMLFLDNNRQLIKEMGEKGKEAVRVKYNWSKDERSLLEAYERIAELKLQ